MFAWLKLNNIIDTKLLIENKAVDKKVLLVPGQAFDPYNKISSYVRLSFSLITDQQLKQGIKRLAQLCQEYHHHLQKEKQ